MRPEEIIDHTRSELRRYVTSTGNGFAEHEAEEMVERMLVLELAGKLSAAMVCAKLTEELFLSGNERAIRQLWNWD